MGMQRGFTLLELIMVLVAAAILLTLGIPSFQNSVRSNRISAAVNDMVASMQLARSEAIKRRVPVTLCTNNGAVDDATANCAAAAWDQGWIVFADPNGNATRDAGEPLLRATSPLRGRVVVTTPPDQPLDTTLVYAPTGFPALGGVAAAGVMVFCDDRESDHFGRVISVPQTGRPLSSTIQSRPDLAVSCE